tara:strand:+ start:260 stop:670 length:411 start_codon:yes stop_codon:yes gene_type:complete
MAKNGLKAVDEVKKDAEDKAVEDKDLDEIADEVEEDAFPLEALDTVNLDLMPSDYEDELLADQCLNALGNYKSATIQAAAARHQGDKDTEKKLMDAAMKWRDEVALIQYRHPNTKPIVRSRARAKAKVAREAREAE